MLLMLQLMVVRQQRLNNPILKLMNQQSNIKITQNKFTWQNGKNWFVKGVDTFKQVKNNWYLSCIILALILALLSNVSIMLVAIVLIFASPMITAFIMNCCYQVKQQNQLNFMQLWQGVFQRINGFIMLGLISAALSLIMQQIFLQLMSVLNLPVELTQEMIENMTGREAFIRAVLNLLTNMPVALALAFSPALILFNNDHPIKAIKFSYLGVAYAWKAFISFVLLVVLLFFGIILMASVITSVFVVVFGGTGQFMLNLLVLFFAFTITGIVLCGQYHAYTEIYESESKEDDEQSEIYAEI